jgi:membrane protein YqaA with SNARE-associated domain
MTDKDGSSAWPSAFVAACVMLFLAGVTIAAIVEYPVDDALKVWAALGSVAGVITGAFVAYFFTRGTVQALGQTAAAERQRADAAERNLTTLVRAIDQISPGWHPGESHVGRMRS